MTAAPSPQIADHRADTAGAAEFAGGAVFRCVLDEQPGYLAPSSAGRPRVSSRRLIINPHCRFSWTSGTPREVAEAAAWLATGAHDPIVWVPTATGWQPFWVGDAYRELLNHCSLGGPVPDGAPNQTVDVLRQAGILVESSHGDAAGKRWHAAAATSARRFCQRRYTTVSGLIHAFQIDALRKYYRRLVRTGGMYLGDAQASCRYACHNEAVSRFFHHQLTDAISEIAGEKVKPSYTYVVSYQGGAELEPHTDREQCEFTLSILVDYPPERERESPWPLCIQPGKRTVRVIQNVGDAILFCGRQLPHFRPKLAEGLTSTTVLLHYVREDFAGPLD